MEVTRMINQVLVKKYMLPNVQVVRAMRGMGQGLSDHYVALCKVRLVDTWVTRREVVNGNRRITSEKLREHLYIKVYARC